MRPLRADEIVGLDRYSELRADYRQRVIAYKRQRRVPVGEKVTLLFEDRETLRFQVQEMLWVERLREPDRVQDELDVYNELMPGDQELSATLFVEVTDASRIRAELDRLIGIDEHVSLVLGGDHGEERIDARFDPKQLDADRIAAVQYLRFPLPPDAARRLGDPAHAARIRIDHPEYRREIELSPAVRASLAAGLSREPAPLLSSAATPGSGASASRGEEPLPTGPAHAHSAPPAPGGEEVFAIGRVRAIRPARPSAPGHLVVEPHPPCSLLEASPELLGELASALRRAAAQIVRRHGSCRIQVDLAEASDPMRWQVLGPRA